MSITPLLSPRLGFAPVLLFAAKWFVALEASLPLSLPLSPLSLSISYSPKHLSLSRARAHVHAHAHALLQVAVSEEDEELGFDLARGQLAGAQPAQERGFAGTALGSSSSRSLEGRAKPPAKNAPGDDPGIEVHAAFTGRHAAASGGTPAPARAPLALAPVAASACRLASDR